MDFLRFVSLSVFSTRTFVHIYALFQLEKLKKMQERSSGGRYFFILLSLIAVVNILDEVTSNLTVTVQSSFVTEFFVNNPFMGKYYTFQEGLALHSGVGVFTYVLGIFTPFYKALADKWGRKPLFAISSHSFLPPFNFLGSSARRPWNDKLIIPYTICKLNCK